ncbi:hypothetical protein [Myroides sp. DF42-4-2]|uniref:hypothetical protein n=1 Tax=unclassified Myroides TaxID=2642485 RepID=UPI002575A401|nr:hypothetical protein [Myroides sp. DF42-4-2]MDM1406550.1 hypothetical protein [Myroides sp. DF42-4-2]
MDRCDSIELNIKKFYSILSDEGVVVGCTPLNFQHKEAWDIFKDVNDFKQVLKDSGFNIIDFFDNLVYKEIMDARESFEEYKVICYVIKKQKN